MPPPPKEKKGARVGKKSDGRKRKHVEEVISDSDLGEDTYEDDDEEEAAQEFRYFPRGTKSRPLPDLIEL